ncbi:MAG: hypothetical protein DRJ15_17600 [Bacteroidetes bacterium]|nr:MAG: hypothetical protein DRJ15_17600 [Bacteroidota bacterium]
MKDKRLTLIRIIIFANLNKEKLHLRPNLGYCWKQNLSKSLKLMFSPNKFHNYSTNLLVRILIGDKMLFISKNRKPGRTILAEGHQTLDYER